MLGNNKMLISRLSYSDEKADNKPDECVYIIMIPLPVMLSGCEIQ